jgi:hypothetical protein
MAGSGSPEDARAADVRAEIGQKSSSGKCGRMGNRKRARVRRSSGQSRRQTPAVPCRLPRGCLGADFPGRPFGPVSE